MTDVPQAHPFAAIAEAVPAFGAAIRRHDSGDLQGARAAYLDLMDQPALTSLCLHQLALIASARGEYPRAAELLRRCIRLDPAQPLAYHNLRAALERAGDNAGAVAALVDLGCIFYNQGDYNQSAELFRQIIMRDPINYAAQINLGTALAWRGDYRDAARHLLLGMELYGRLVKEVGNFARMIEGRLSTWLGFHPGHAMLPPGLPHGAIEKIEDALTTLGKLLNDAGHSEDAMLCLRKSVEMAPGFALGHWNLSLALLGSGDFAQGWREYEWRWHWDRFPEPRRLLPLPLWRGEPLDGKRILVWTEQGFGDAIHTVPLALQLKSQGADIYLEAPSALVRLFRQSFPGINVVERPDNPHALAFDTPLDFVVPLMSLADRLVLQTSDLPLATEYVTASSEDLALWRERLPPSDRPRVGVIWAGRSAHAEDNRRSIPFEVIERLFVCDKVHWHSLQVGPAQAALQGNDSVEDLSPYLADFADTAAAMAQLDLIISVDTGPMHLAAALGRPVWQLARTPPDWRWTLAATHSPWYPTMRIFRQDMADDWSQVLDEVFVTLNDWAVEHKPAVGPSRQKAVHDHAAQS
jgi:tetratricopeptide (TPR) repeat protein